MALITHIGGAESDSMVTVAEALTLLTDLETDLTDWNALSTLRKELCLRMAAEMVGRLPLRGKKVFRYQRLSFPRTSQPYERRFIYPTEVKQAQVLLANSVVRPALAQSSSWELDRPTRISLGGLVSVDFAEEGGTVSLFSKMLNLIPPQVYLLMQSYIAVVRGRTVLNDEDAMTLSTTTTTV